MKKILFLCMLVVASIHVQAAEFNHNIWDGLLKKHVITLNHGEVTQVDYAGMAADKPELKVYLSALSAVKPEAFDDIEQGYIRAEGRYQNPYIHFALNCASIGCPPLRPEAYTGAQLDTQLKAAAGNFLRDRTRNRLNGDRLEVSKIFKWYHHDFERGWKGFHTLADFFAQNSQALGLSASDLKRLQTGKIEIEYLDYNWNLNRKS